MRKILKFIMDEYIGFDDRMLPSVVRDYYDNIWCLVIKNRMCRICDGVGYRSFRVEEVRYSYGKCVKNSCGYEKNVQKYGGWDYKHSFCKL